MKVGEMERIDTVIKVRKGYKMKKILIFVLAFMLLPSIADAAWIDRTDAGGIVTAAMARTAVRRALLVDDTNPLGL